MQVATALKTIEKSVEKELLAFFQLLGASEAPEEWYINQPVTEEQGRLKGEDKAPH